MHWGVLLRCAQECAAEVSRLVGCDTVLLGERLPMFWGNMLPLCSESGGPRIILPGALDPQNEESTSFRNSVDNSPSDAVSHPRRHQFSSFHMLITQKIELNSRTF